jgi:hypothetical protein
MTAVEWLEEELKANLKKVILEGDSKLMESLFEQAKEMDKEEKIDFADKYGTYLLQGGIMSAAAYNETFKSE